MTLPSASTLTDEQLRVLAAEANGWTKTGHTAFGWENKTTDKIAEDVYELPDPLHDANAAKGLLEKDHWQSNWDTSTATIAIFRPEKTYLAKHPTSAGQSCWPTSAPRGRFYEQVYP